MVGTVVVAAAVTAVVVARRVIVAASTAAAALSAGDRGQQHLAALGIVDLEPRDAAGRQALRQRGDAGLTNVPVPARIELALYLTGLAVRLQRNAAEHDQTAGRLSEDVQHRP